MLKNSVTGVGEFLCSNLSVFISPWYHAAPSVSRLCKNVPSFRSHSHWCYQFPIALNVELSKCEQKLTNVTACYHCAERSVLATRATLTQARSSRANQSALEHTWGRSQALVKYFNKETVESKSLQRKANERKRKKVILIKIIK